MDIQIIENIKTNMNLNYNLLYVYLYECLVCIIKSYNFWWY